MLQFFRFLQIYNNFKFRGDMINNSLSIKNLNIKIGDFEIKDFSFFLRKESITVLIGENGCGKTTLFKCIFALYPFGGSIMVNGVDSKSKSLYFEQLAFVGDSVFYPPYLTPKECFDLYKGLYETFDEYVYFDFLNRFSVSPQKKLYKLTNGEAVVFQIAMAIFHNPSLIILDEPFDGLTYKERLDIYKFLREYVSEKKASVLLSSHLVDDLDCMADALALFKNGKICFSISPEECLRKYGNFYNVRSLSNIFYFLLKEEAL